MLPREWIDEMRALLGGELEAFLQAEEEPPALAMRINPLRPGAMNAAKGFIGDRVPWAEGAFYLQENARPGASLAHDLGAFYLQEASAMVSARVLDAQPGERVLDLCAAPGGKSTQIAGAMRGRGALICNEPVPSRSKILAENLERMGVVNAAATCAYPNQLSEKWPEFFDAVLVDAPCSGEGMFRRNPSARDEWNPGAPAGCAKRQAEILDEAAKMVRAGGRLVYSTCTFNRLEDEGSVEGFLKRHPEFEIENFELEGIGKSEGGMLRVWPHRVRGDGHFVARMRKIDEGAKIAERRKQRGRKAEKENLEPLVRRLEEESARIPECLKTGRLIRQGDYVHILPEGAPRMDGVKLAKPGLCLMRVGRSHVQPMPALARACTAEGDEVDWMGTARRTIELDEDGVARFRRGERFQAKDRGWTLLCWHGLPLGWTKVIE